MTGKENDFEVKLGYMRTASGHKRVTGFFKQVGRSAKRSYKGSGNRRSARASPQNYFHRRVMVKVSIVKLKGRASAAHIRYLERDGTERNGERSQMYDERGPGADTREFTARGEDDRHQFRVIVSPEDGRDMADLTGFTQDLVSQMQRDLETKLDWVAVNHYDTAQPHTHIVIRGVDQDGKDLRIPRDYISRGIRERAQSLVSIELGPISELEGRNRFARMVSKDRFTELDRGLLKGAEGDVIDLSKPPPKSRLWRRHLEHKRLKRLRAMGLAEPLGKGRWQLDPQLQSTLTRMGERGDIIKTLRRAMSETGQSHLVDSAAIFEPGSSEISVAGEIVKMGVADDIKDQSFLILKKDNGKLVYLDIGKSERLLDFDMGKSVQASTQRQEPKPSDYTIAEIAKANGGIYSAEIHKAQDPSASPEYVEAHIRRLEAMRRLRAVNRQKDGSWKIPKNYIESISSNKTLAIYGVSHNRDKVIQLTL